MATIGVGVIGWGFMGKTHTQALRSIPLYYPGAGFDIALRCVCARHWENAREGARAAGFEHFTDDYRELLAREDIDVVAICTPNDQHEEMAVALDRAEALLKGKGAWRIHGGGFAGCIQCLTPEADWPAFREKMDGFYGEGACFELRIRPCGVFVLDTE